MIRIIHAEILRLTTTRQWMWALIASVACGGGLIGMLTVVGPQNFDPPMPGLNTAEGVRGMLGLLSITVMVPAAWGTLAMTSEYHHGTITSTFAFAPRRGAVLFAKLATITIGGGIYGLVQAVTAAIGLYAGSAVASTPVGLDASTVATLLLRLAATMAVYALLGAAMGALIPHRITALAIVVGYLYLGEYVLLAIPGVNTIYPFLPGGATAALTDFSYVADAMADQISGSASAILPTPIGAIVLLGYAAVAAVLAVAMPLRRDVT